MAPEATPKKSCFVISPIGADGSEIRKRADRVFKHVIKPPCDDFGYEPVRADHIARAGMITTQIVEQILQSDLVIADLTGQNANVFYELAIRHAVHKPYIQIIESGDTLPFDIAGLRTIHVKSDDLDSVDEARAAIKKQMDDFERNGSPIESPISTALNLLRLQGSEDPEQRSLGAVIEALGDFRGEFNIFTHTVHRDGAQLETMATMLRNLTGEVEELRRSFPTWISSDPPYRSLSEKSVAVLSRLLELEGSLAVAQAKDAERGEGPSFGTSRLLNRRNELRRQLGLPPFRSASIEDVVALEMEKHDADHRST